MAFVIRLPDLCKNFIQSKILLANLCNIAHPLINL